MLKGFAEVVEIPETKKDEKYIFGTIKNNGDSSYVTFDGSDFLTPIISAMGYEDGDRVMVMVKNHRAIVVNNMTSPAVTGKYVKENYASFENLSAVNAQLVYLRANMITADVLEAKIGEFGYLKADVAELKFASIESLNTTNAEIVNLKSTTVKTDNLSAEVAKLGYIKATELDAVTARIDTLESIMITADNLRTEIAKIGYLTTDEADIRYLTVSTANATFLHADMSDMDIAKIQTLFATAGIVSDMTIKDGHITGVLDSVTVNADSITAGTLSVDRLIIRGSEKSLVYELNNVSGALQAKSVDTLNGEILTQRTITADKLVAKSITSNEIKAATITSDEIAVGTIKAANINVIDLVGDSAFINSLQSNTVIVGLQNDINGISVGGRNLLIQKSLTNGYIDKYTGIYVAQSGSGNWTTGNISVTGYDQVTVSFYENHSDTTLESYLHQYTSDGVYVRSDICDLRSPGSITIPIAANTAIIRATLVYCNTLKWKLEKGNKATDWTPAPEDVDSLISAAQNTADSAVSAIGTWCYNNDITYINGSKIYTGTITADKLSVDAITSRNYVKDVAGTKISLADGSYDSKYTKIDAEGKIECNWLNCVTRTKGQEACGISIKNLDSTYVYNITIMSDGMICSDESTQLFQLGLVHNISNGSASGLIILQSNNPQDTMECRITHSGLKIGNARMNNEPDGGVVYLYNSSDGGKLFLSGSNISWTSKDKAYTWRCVLDDSHNISIRGGQYTDIEIVSINSTRIYSFGDVVTRAGASLNSLASSLANKQPFNSAGSLFPASHLNYFYSGVALGSSIPGAPNSAWFMIVAAGVSGTTVQRAYDLFQGSCYHRYCAAGTWSAWKLIY